MANTLNTFDQGDVRTTTIVTEAYGFDAYNQELTEGVQTLRQPMGGDNKACVLVKESLDSMPTTNR